MIWARMLAYITGTVDQELLLRNEYLAAENRILRAQIQGRLLLSDAEKATLAEIARRLGRKALEELAAVAKPDTLLAWYRKLIATKFDGSKFRKSLGRPRVDEETEQLVVRMAKENPGWRRVRPRHSPYAKGLLITSPGPLIGKNGILARDGIRNSTQRCAAGQDRSAESRDDRPGRGPLAGMPRRGVVASLHRNAGVFAVATWQGGERPELRQGELLRR